VKVPLFARPRSATPSHRKSRMNEGRHSVEVPCRHRAAS